MKRSSLLLLLVLCVPAAVQAQRPGRHSAAPSRPPSGPIQLNVDASDAARKLLQAQVRRPASPGALTLVYPKWLPGEHGPTGPITDLVGVRCSAGGKPIVWNRDPVDMYAFHVDVPAG